MRSNQRKTYFSLKCFWGIVLAAVVFCSLFLVGCKNKYTNVSNDVDYYTEQKYALESGSSYTFDLKEIFADSGLDIDK